jgi:hypothetical protein
MGELAGQFQFDWRQLSEEPCDQMLFLLEMFGRPNMSYTYESFLTLDQTITVSMGWERHTWFVTVWCSRQLFGQKRRTGYTTMDRKQSRNSRRIILHDCQPTLFHKHDPRHCWPFGMLRRIVKDRKSNSSDRIEEAIAKAEHDLTCDELSRIGHCEWGRVCSCIKIYLFPHVSSISRSEKQGTSILLWILSNSPSAKDCDRQQDTLWTIYVVQSRSWSSLRQQELQKLTNSLQNRLGVTINVNGDKAQNKKPPEHRYVTTTKKHWKLHINY